MTDDLYDTYQGPKERAKRLRATLKENFPGVKFSVRFKSYAGGDTIYVRWGEAEVGEIDRGGTLFKAVYQHIAQTKSRWGYYNIDGVPVWSATDEDCHVPEWQTEEEKNKLIEEVEDVLAPPSAAERFRRALKVPQAKEETENGERRREAMILPYDFDYRALWVEVLFTDGFTWYEAERRVRLEEVESVLDGLPLPGEPPHCGVVTLFFEYLSQPAYHGA